MENRQARERHCLSLLNAVKGNDNISFQQRVDIVETDLNDELTPAEIKVLTMLIDAKILGNE